MHPYSPQLKQLSRDLRKNMTTAEKLLWSKLRMKQINGLMFSRQKPLGKYIADFYCHPARLVVEIDGGHHFSDEAKEYDRIRGDYLKSLGLTVLRFTNSDVIKNIDAVLEGVQRRTTCRPK